MEKSFLQHFYFQVSRALFEEDRVLFGFLLAIRMQMLRKQIDLSDIRFLVSV
jgi:hypothetical protein